jgi:hypothetical protein
MAQNRISLFHIYNWDESPTGVVTISEADPYYYGGWTVIMQPLADSDIVLARNGLTLYQVTQPLLIDYRSGTVTLDATSDEPFVSVSGTKTITSDGSITRVDSVQYFYVVNEEWMTGGELADVEGTVDANSNIHIPGGFAYYIETVKTTTITNDDGTSRTFTDETADVSRIFRDLRLLVPNGKHEFTDVATGEARMVDVYIRQSGDTVYVTNIYGYGAPEIAMILNSDGTMTYPAQMLRDIPNGASTGDGFWYNATPTGGSVTAGCTGNADVEAITWGLTEPWDHARTWSGWTDNMLYYTDGSTFVIPSAVTYDLGDVNHDGFVNVADVTALIQYVLGNDPEPFYVEEANVSGDAEGEINVADVTALIAIVLTN